LKAAAAACLKASKQLYAALPPTALQAVADPAGAAIDCYAAQVLWLSVVMIPLYALNQQLVFGSFKALDVGGSISIHAFGAYYGLAASLVLSRCVSSGSRNRKYSYEAIGHRLL
jgi:ammonia channel protein AmtB